MCGRFSTFGLSPELLTDLFDLSEVAPFEPGANIAPSLPVPVIREENHIRRLVALRWGLIPSWSKDSSIGSRMINARMETLSEKPSFRKAFATRRCLIPARGFYEWAKQGKARQPFYIFRPDGKPLVFAGLWEHWVEGATGEVVESCAIITGASDEMLAKIHDRMPVMFSLENAARWLDSDLKDPADLKALLESPRQVALDMYPVSSYVNSVGNDGPRCFERVGGEGAGRTDKLQPCGQEDVPVS